MCVRGVLCVCVCVQNGSSRLQCAYTQARARHSIACVIYMRAAQRSACPHRGEDDRDSLVDAKEHIGSEAAVAVEKANLVLEYKRDRTAGCQQ